MKKPHRLIRVLWLLLSLTAGKLFAHDFWLEAQPFYTERGKTVDLSVHVGNEFVGDSLPNIPSWYTDFSLYQRASKTPIEGALGDDPAGYFKPTQTGTYSIGYHSDVTYTEIDSDTFNRYLNEEGLENAIEYRRKNGQSALPGKEDYMRHVKALVQSGSGFDVDYSDLQFGYELEIIPLQNPYKKSINDQVEFQVLYQNRPEFDILVAAFSKIEPEQVQRIRSNRQGIVRITLDQPGPWLVKAVKIIRLENKKPDWQSHWATLTFAMK